MDEANAKKLRPTRSRVLRSRKKRRKQAGQAMIEYILLFVVSLIFARFVFFHPEFGINGMLDRMMMRLGTNLEQNLKTGASGGATGNGSLDPYAGAGTWNN